MFLRTNPLRYSEIYLRGHVLEINLIGLILVLLGTSICVSAVIIAFNQWKRLGADLYKQLSIAFVFLSLMCIGYMFAALYNASVYQDMVLRWQIFFASFGLAFLGFMVRAFEYLKKKPEESRVNSVFILAGAVIATRFLPGQYDVVWIQNGWEQHYGMGLIVLSILLYAVTIAYTIPVFYRAWSRIKQTNRYRMWVRSLFALLFLSAALVGAYLIASRVFHWVPDIFTSISYFLFAPFIGIVVGLTNKLLISYPTIFFVSTHDLIELQIISKDSNEMTYRFSFDEHSAKERSLVPGAHHTIRQVFRQLLDTSEELESIRVQEGEVLVYEGEQTTGLLYTIRGSQLFKNLLKLTAEKFENDYDPSSFSEAHADDFEMYLRDVFQFALTRPEEVLER
ncbi:hypothetical protein EU537_02670 [Candidatus Thorarchaeota archaeon]|nr:MAG: hypothetical protein EU537_02670 [Candidatus Thorarchaeota archaeon]